MTTRIAASALAALLALPLSAVAADPPPLLEPSQTQSPGVYAARRAALMKAMGDGVAVVFSEGVEDAAGYRPSSDFFWLTGVDEEGAILVLAPKERTYREFLFLPGRDPEAERWTGERAPLSGALRKRYGFEKIHRTDRLDRTVFDVILRSPTFWQVSFHQSKEDGRPKDLALYGRYGGRIPGVSVKTLGRTLAGMRARHDSGELAILEHGIRLTEAGHRAAWKLVRPGASEGEVRAEAERVWRAGGSRRPAYESIVGSGPNSTILHYPRSERVMKDGELLLLDMGCEWGHYASDITRTLPVGGRFTPEQRKVYDTVLRAQAAAFALVKPGAYWEDVDAAARKVVEDAGYGDDFIHGLGHFVGLDVHDAGDYGAPLAPGMVLTIEPGIYVQEKALGVRIEDEVLVTENGARWLTLGLPKTADDVERWMAERTTEVSH